VVSSSMSEDCSGFIFYGWILKLGTSHQTQHNVPQYLHPHRQSCENLKSFVCWHPLFHYITFSPCPFLAHPLSRYDPNCIQFINLYAIPLPSEPPKLNIGLQDILIPSVDGSFCCVIVEFLQHD